MYGISTLTQKGQVAIPKAIRDHFGLKTSDKIEFRVEENKIVAEPVAPIKSMFGILHDKAKGKKPLTKKEMRKIISDAVLKKHASRT